MTSIPRWRASRSVVLRLVTVAALGLSSALALPASGAERPGESGASISQGATAGVFHRHLAYEAELAASVLSRLGPSDAGAARQLLAITRLPLQGLARRMAADHQSEASARRAWEASVGTGAPRPGERSHFACSIGIRRSDAAALAATPAAELGGQFASIELGLMVEGRQLAAALPPDDELRLAVDAAQRQALHALAPLLIPTDQAFAASA
ncbi:MAG: hypothetical protein NVS3B12_03070 [Acidimicrobiales bacterium]